MRSNVIKLLHASYKYVARYIAGRLKIRSEAAANLQETVVNVLGVAGDLPGIYRSVTDSKAGPSWN